MSRLLSASLNELQEVLPEVPGKVLKVGYLFSFEKLTKAKGFRYIERYIAIHHTDKGAHGIRILLHDCVIHLILFPKQTG